MSFLVRIQPVTRDPGPVIETIMLFLGPDSRERALTLVEQGGVVLQGLNQQAAEHTAQQLEESGAIPSVEQEEGGASALTVRVLDRVSNQPVPDAFVEVAGDGEAFASSTTDAQGEVRFERFGTLVREVFSDRRPEITVQVQREGKSVDVVHKPFKWDVFDATEGTMLFLVSAAAPDEEADEEDDARLSIRGRVTRSDGEPAAGVVLRAYDRDLRGETLLGEAKTDNEGRYEVRYTPESFAADERGGADLLLRVYTHTGRELSAEVAGREVPTVGGQQILFNAGEEEEVNLVITSEDAEPSRYEEVVDALTPLPEGVTFTSLSSEDVLFLHYETGLPLNDVAFVVEDVRLYERAGLPEAIFFGLGHQGIGVLPAENEGRPPRIDLPTVLDEPVGRIMEAVETALGEAVIPAVLGKELENIRARFEELKTTNREESVGAQRKRVEEVGRIAGLDEEKAKQVAEHLSGGLVTAGVLDDLVQRDILTTEQVGDVKFTFELGALTQNNLQLTEALKSGRVSPVGGPVRTMRDLVALDAQGWEAALEQNEVKPPDGMERPAYAASLARRVESRYPTAVLAERTVRRDRGNLAERVASIRPLIEGDRLLFSKVAVRSGPPIPLGFDLGDADEAVKADVRELTSLARTFRHLGVAETLDRTDLAPSEVAGEVARRVGALGTFFDNNAELDLRSADLLELGVQGDGAPAVSFDGIEDDLQPLIREQAKAYQRVQNVAPDAETTEAFLRAGYDSSHAIVADAPETIAENTGYTIDEARYYRRTSTSRVAVARLVGHIVEAETDLSTLVEPYAVRVPKRTDSELRRIREVLGSQNFCGCRHCSSVLSPAAYFVDLMAFVEQHVSDVAFKDQPNHSLHLRTRRPDLWELPLTCENTNTLIPYLDVINEVLERYVAGENFQIDDGEETPTPTEQRAEEAYRFLKIAQNSFEQPFHLPLEELRVYLGHFGLTLAGVIEELEGWGQKAARESLQLSPEAWKIVAHPNENQGLLKRLFGYDPRADLSDPDTTLDMKSLLKATELTREEADRLFQLEAIGGRGTLEVKVIYDENDDLRPLREEISGLGVALLDRIHRFVRLWRTLPWELEALDFVVRRDAAALIAPQGDSQVSAEERTAALERIAALRRLQRQLDIPVDVLCAITGLIPLAPLAPNQTPLFDRLFNPPRLAPNKKDEWRPGPQPADSVAGDPFQHPALAGPGVEVERDPDAPNFLHRLLGGLGVSDAELEVLLRHLLASSANADTGEVDLTHERLSLLYRHAKLAKRLGLPVQDLFAALRLVQGVEDAKVTSLEDVQVLTGFVKQLRESPFTVRDLHFIVRNPLEGSPGYRFGEDDLRSLVEEAAGAASNVTFTAEAFYDISEIERADVDVLLAALVKKGLVDDLSKDSHPAGPQTYRVASTYDPGQPLSIAPDDVDDDVDPEVLDRLNGEQNTIRNTLESLLPERSGLSRIATALDTDTETLTLLLALAGLDVRDRSAVLGLMSPPTANDPLAPELIERLQRIEEAARWAEVLELNVEALSFVAAHAALFGLMPGDRTSLESLLRLSTYAQLRRLGDLDTLHDLLNDLESNSEADPERLGQLTGTTAIQAWSFIKHVPPAVTNPVDQLAVLVRRLRLGQRVGVDGRTLSLLTSTAFEQLGEARDLVLGAFRARYEGETAFEEVIEPYRDKLRGRRRDALVDYILTLPELSFEKTSDLYHYFLLDTELEGCARTSRIVAATNSLQLYVQRCLMNLEQDESGGVRVVPPEEMAEEWPWRKNYRVWEANRKVFLHTENFVEPDLRDNKSPLFRRLEDELLQQDITDETVEAAYRTYLEGFRVVANLSVAGSCYDPASRTFHFIGRVGSDADGRLYHRTYRRGLGTLLDTRGKGEWSPWEEVGVTTGAAFITPLVFKNSVHITWVEDRPRKDVDVEGGSIIGDKDYYRIVLRHSERKTDGTWSTPSELELFECTRFDKSWLPSGKVYPYVQNRRLNVLYRKNDLVRDGSVTRVRTALRAFRIDLFDYVARRTSPPSSTAEFYPIRRHRSRSNGGLLVLERSERYRHDADIDDEINRQSDGGAVEITKFIDNVGYFISPPRAHASFLHQAVVNGPGNYLLKVDQSTFFLERNQVLLLVPVWQSYRLTSNAAEELTRLLAEEGLDGFLSLKTQLTYGEEAFPLPLKENALLLPPEEVDGRLDFGGPLGLYYRELFFHIPLLLAQHLNANGRYAEAQRWLHYVFDPTTSERPSETSPVQHYWKYLELRLLEEEGLGKTLADGAALEVYRRDPFNPHAIARLRMSAYRKATLMRYIDNLLDWGDHLFAQDTRESIGEAALLYVMAADLLGERPVQLGTCDLAGDEIDERPITYADLEPDRGFLYTAENVVSSFLPVRFPVLSRDAASTGDGAATVTPNDPVFTLNGGLATEQLSLALTTALAADASEPRRTAVAASATNAPYRANARAAVSTVPIPIQQSEGQKQVFCVPRNKQLEGYWDRVEDRLFKIRNCLNLSGVRRELALFAPPIDPALLVRAKAAGLSLEDALALSNPSVPPYRFTYLLAKAKEYTAAVRGFGGALLAALEKKDAADLTLLRSEHQQNILKLTRDLKQHQIDLTKENLAALQISRATASFRKDYYNDLIEEGLSSYEEANLAFTAVATAFEVVSSTINTAASIGYAVPQVGSPFAMTYGGQQLGAILTAVGGHFGNLATLNRFAAAASATLGGYDRREEGWTLQRDLAKEELKQIDKQIIAAEIRIAMAEHELSIHDTSAEQAEEIYRRYQDQFSNLGLYVWLSKELGSLYRSAYNTAHEVALMAQAAYRYERDDDAAFFVEPGHWDSQKAGLLAGERLQFQLSQMEKAYLETNRRDSEVDQTFSLAQIDPLALHTLREKGTCEFEIPEVFFDIAYPGQYKRRIRSVRLTIPCVTGPYVNVNAKLTLLQSHLRKEADLDASAYIEEPRSRYTSIATSRAQNDGGVFELSFRGERYMPFEGAGAVSRWSLELPDKFRSFDYDTVTDVLVHISYTAKDAGTPFKDNVVQIIESELNKLAKGAGVTRAFSLRQEFATEFRHLFLTNGTEEQTVTVRVNHRHFPHFLREQVLTLEDAILALKLREPWAAHYAGEGGGNSNDSVRPLAVALTKSGATTIRSKALEVNGGVEPFATIAYPHATFDLGETIPPNSSGLPLSLEVATSDLKAFVTEMHAAVEGPGTNGSDVPLEALHKIVDDVYLVLTVKPESPTS